MASKSTVSDLSVWASPLLRLGFGALFLGTGVLKLFNSEGFVGFVLSLGLPLASVLAWIVIVIEVLGGLFLLLGLWTRWSSLALGVLMLLILLLVQILGLVQSGDPGNFLKDLTIFLGLLALSCLGSKKWSLTRD